MKRQIFVLLIGLKFLSIMTIINTTSTTLLVADNERFNKWFNFGVVEFFETVVNGAPFNFTPKGIRKQVRISIIERSEQLPPAEADQVWKIVNGIISRDTRLIQNELYLLQLYCRLPISINHPEVLERLISNGKRTEEVLNLLEVDHWRNHPQHDRWYEALTGRSFAEANTPVTLPGKPGVTLDGRQTKLYNEVQRILAKKKYKGKEFKIVMRWMKQEVSAEYPEQLMQFLHQIRRTNSADFEEVIDKVLTRKHWVNSPWAPEMLAFMLHKGKWKKHYIHEKVAKRVLPDEAFVGWPELALMIASKHDGRDDLEEKTLSKRRWKASNAARAYTGGKKPDIDRMRKAGEKKSLKKWAQIVTDRCQQLRTNATASTAGASAEPVASI